MTRNVLAALFAVIAVAAGASTARAQERSPAEIARRVHARGGYPAELRVREGGTRSYVWPERAVAEAHRGAAEGSASERGSGGASSPLDREHDAASAPRGRDHRTPPETAAYVGRAARSLFGGLAWVVLVVALAIALPLVAMTLARLRATGDPGRATLAPDEISPSIAGKRERLATRDPDALIAEGRFEEAIAVLLHRALTAAGWRPDGIGTSRTSREVLAMIARGDPRRPPLERIVHIAESVRFGGSPATAASCAAMRANLALLVDFARVVP